MSTWVLVSVIVLLLSACWTDLRRMKIPNELTITFAGGGMLFHLLANGVNGLGWAVAGALSGFLPLYVMNRFGGIGGGDVKWFGAFGAWTGPYLTLQLLVFSILIAGGIAFTLLLLRLPGLRWLGTRMKWPWGNHPLTAGKAVRFPFMLAVAPGFITLLGKG
ncbi:A24 family peptidase [Cohnella cholangitidis]|uniref:Prepilin peptidase n=1 Tax=Cohnella cholangitidis TaxID=2598458 RepID=A0A7G5C2D0_9BACL|nr:A24 family peptidase [Cohnella cholangitidis]QMV43364.1 prepilin peptidase [Cohnella cholangitidis]